MKRYSPEEYYRLERNALEKSDYFDGRIYSAGGVCSPRSLGGDAITHCTITTNIAGELRSRLKGKPCAAYESNLRLRIKTTGLRCYPDVSVFCGPLERDPEDANLETVTNPTVLFEVLSPSTEAYDRGFKAGNYRQIESLRAYVLVSQAEAHAEVYTRQGDGSWLLREAKGMRGLLAIPSIGIDLPLAEIYDRVDFNVADPAQGAVPRA